MKNPDFLSFSLSHLCNYSGSKSIESWEPIDMIHTGNWQIRNNEQDKLASHADWVTSHLLRNSTWISWHGLSRWCNWKKGWYD